MKVVADCELLVETSTLKAQVKFHSSDQPRVERAVGLLHNHLNLQDEDLQWLLSQLRNLPVVFKAPRNLSLDERSKPYLRSQQTMTHRHQDIIQKILDVDSGLIDPLSFLGVLKKERHNLRKNMQAHQSLSKFLEREYTSQAQMFIARMFIVQNHYITERCRQCLVPALSLAGAARDELKDFIKAETGHDLLLADSLQKMPMHQETPVINAIKELGSLLQDTATKSFLGICVMIDYFEEGDLGQTRPLDKAIKAWGLESACRGYFIHRDINFDGHHEDIAADLLKSAQGFTVEEAQYVLEVFDKMMHLEQLTSEEMLDVLTKLQATVA